MSKTVENEYIKEDIYKIQVPVISLEHQKIGTKIDLIGAIHIASPRYYDQVLSLLQQDDIVLYEFCGWGKVDRQTKEKFLFFLKIDISQFYRELANHANNYYWKRFSQMNSAISQVNLDKINHPKADELKKQLKDIMWYLTQKSEILNADVDVQLVYQWDKINYRNLPDNRKHADMTEQNLVDTMRIFSLENVYFLFLKISLVFIRKYFMKSVAKHVISGKLDSSMTSENHTRNELHRNREEMLFKKIQEYENLVNRIGVFYWAWHLKSIEEHLLQHWYVRKNITYLDSIRRYSKIIEEEDNDPASNPFELKNTLT